MLQMLLRGFVLTGVLLTAFLGTRLPQARADAYEVGPGDTLAVVVLGQTEMTGDFRVDAEGLITFPILGKVKASSHSVADLERKLTTLLADGYLKRPQVSVSVKEYGSQKVFVTGEVQRPGSYPLKADRSLLALMGDIGSVTPNAGHEVVVIRPPAGSSLPAPILNPDEQAPAATPTASPALPFEVAGAEVFRISLQELQSGNPERNILLQAGDTVYVPRASQVYVTGSVSRPGPYRFQEGMTVLQALTLAGGVTERGSSGRVKIIRVVAGKKQEVKVKLSDPVSPEDTLVVPERFF
jgi:polysaccharide export outer membrane protein